MGRFISDKEMAEIDAIDAQNSQTKKGRFVPDEEMAEIDAIDSYSDPKTSPVTTVTTGLLREGLPFASTLAGIGKAGLDAASGLRGPLAGGDLSEIADSYRQGRDNFSNDYKTAAAANPGLSMVTGIGAQFINPLSRGAKTLGQNIGAAAIQGVGTSDADLTKGELAETTGDAISSTLGAAVGHGVGQLGVGAVKRGLKGAEKAINYGSKKLRPVADYILKKSAKAVGNIPEEYAGDYIARKGKIEAPESIQTMDAISNDYRVREKAVNEAKELVGSSKEAFAKAEQKLQQQIADHKYQNSSNIQRANDDYQNATRSIQEGMKSKNLTGLKDEVIQAIKDLKEKVIHGSVASYEALGKEKGNVNISGTVHDLNRGLDSLLINGEVISDTAAKSQKNLMALKDRFSKIAKNGNEVSFAEAKAIIQQLDQDIDYGMRAGEFFPQEQAIKVQMRKRLNKTLRLKSKEYRKIMDEVSDDAGLLTKVSEAFGEDSRAITRLNQIASEKGKALDYPLLNRLGEKTSRRFDKPIQEFIAIQDTLSSPTAMKRIKEATPEYQALAEHEATRSKLTNPATKRELERGLEQGVEGKSFREAEEALLKAKEEFKPVEKFGHGSVQAKVKALIGARNYDAEKLFSDLDQATGKNYTQQVKDRAILDSFEKSDTQGSRKTLLGAIAGKAAAGAIGGTVGAIAGYGASDSPTVASIGATTGAGIGFTLDRYSGQVIKALLDKRIRAGFAKNELLEKFGKYTPQIIKAAEKGPRALSVLGAVLMRNPDFKKLVGAE